MAAARDTCFYDGLCGMCRRTTRILRAVDFLGRLSFVDLTSVPEAELPVDIATALRGMPMRTRSGRTLVGFPAVRRAMAQTLLAPLAWPMYIPVLNWISGAVYRHIAANRRRACAIDPAGRGPGGLPAPGAQRILRP